MTIKKVQILFFISGFSALIYQIIWQKKLFLFFGVNIEATTMIVSIFLLGLGFGALLGGKLSETIKKENLLKTFTFAEAIIGIFGIISIYFFNIEFSSQIEGILLSMIFLFFPIMLMGISFPLLVELFKTKIPSKTIAKLYFSNTLGAAISCFLTIFWFNIVGITNTLLIGAFFNFLIIILVYIYIKKGNVNE